MHSKPPRISDGLRAKFQEIATEAAELLPPSAYANYMIIDPTTADPEKVLPGAAIYVGQTSELRSRILSHLRQAIRPAPEHAQLYHYMARLIGRGAWPLFRVLETHTNRVDCMLAETVWAQRLLRSGARLFNTWPEQSRLLTKSSLRRMQRARLFLLSLRDAEAAGLDLEIACRAGCYTLLAAPKNLAAWFGRRITLKGVRERSLRCPICGGLNRFSLTPAAETTECNRVPELPQSSTADLEARLFLQELSEFQPFAKPVPNYGWPDTYA